MILHLTFFSFLILFVSISRDAYGSLLFSSSQSDDIFFSQYTKNNTVLVNPFDNLVATVLCENGDDLTTGGYIIGFNLAPNLDNVYIYENRPVLLETDTRSQEGWQTGLANNQNETMSITATVLGTDNTS